MIRTTLSTLAILLTSSLSQASDDPPVGTILSLPVVSVSLTACGSGREVRRAVYAPPPGWYVRSHRVVMTEKCGSVTYVVNTVPAGWAWRSEEQAGVEGRSSAAGTLSAYKVTAGGQVATAQSSATTGLQANASSHHLLVVDVAARGPGVWQGQSAIELTVVADLVYLGK